nr:MAG TPA: hypothetical protein [Caudoviricetes sp.]
MSIVRSKRYHLSPTNRLYHFFLTSGKALFLYKFIRKE